MSRPGEKITRKSILMQKKIKELDKTEVSSKSLLANVLDIDDNFCASTVVTSSVNGNHVNNNHCVNLMGNGCSYPVPRVVHAPVTEEKTLSSQPLHRELSLILKEIKVITDKIRDDDEAGSVENDWKFAAMVIDRLCLIGK